MQECVEAPSFGVRGREAGRAAAFREEWECSECQVTREDIERGKEKVKCFWVRTKKKQAGCTICMQLKEGLLGIEVPYLIRGWLFFSHLCMFPDKSAFPEGGLLARWLTGPIGLTLKEGDRNLDCLRQLRCHISSQGPEEKLRLFEFLTRKK